MRESSLRRSEALMHRANRLMPLRALCSPRRELPKESEQAQPPPAATRPRLPSHGPPSNEEQCMARRVRALQECGKSAVADRQLQQQQQRIAIRARLLHTTLRAAALLRTECPAACARTGMAPLSRIGARGRACVRALNRTSSWFSQCGTSMAPNG